MGFDIPWVGGLIYYGLECHNSMGRWSMHHGYGGKITMGRGFDVPWVGFQNTMDKWEKIPWLGDQYTMSRGVQYTVSKVFNIL
jgi:hypothetical protein